MVVQINIILADDHPIVRQGLRRVIETAPDLHIAAECGDGAAALAAVEQFAPDVAVLDVDMPLATGFEVLRHLTERQAATRVILLTVHDEPEFLHEAMRLGAAAYVLKESAIEEIVTAIRLVAAGENFVSERLAQLLQTRRSHGGANNGLASLTTTERKVLKLIAEYKTTNEIADGLFISQLTVKTHRRNISTKLEIEGANQLMKFALENKTLL